MKMIEGLQVQLKLNEQEKESLKNEVSELKDTLYETEWRMNEMN